MRDPHIVISIVIEKYIGNELIVTTVLSPWDKSLKSRTVRIPVDINQKGRRHQMRRLVSLFVKDVIIGITNQRSIIRVEKQLPGNLSKSDILFILSRF